MNRSSSFVRFAELSDAESIHRLSTQLGYEPTCSKTSESRLQALLLSETDFVWVYERENELLGWLHAFVAQRLASAAFVELGGLIVDQAARRVGVGRTLVQAASGEAKKLDMTLRVRCNAKRTETHQFYRELGFDELKQQRVFSG